jgi:dihydrodipicolinate synthase/N-acetylneuraminate lyase
LEIDRAVGLPIVLYNYPGRMGTMMQAEFLDRVGRSRNVKAIKESSGKINQLHMLARDYPHIALLCGMNDQGVVAACCQNGLGSVKGTLAGRLAADLAVGCNEPMVADMLAYEEPKRIYPEPFMSIGANARLWWLKQRAGSDF